LTIPIIETSFNSGELSPSLYGRVELPKWHSGCSVARNMVVNYKGGLFSRAGTAEVGICKQPASATSTPPRIIEFRFNIYQSYILEFGDYYMRVVVDGAYVTEAAFNISAISTANPGVFTVPGHNYVNGDWIFLNAILGPITLNGIIAIVQNVAGNNFNLTDPFGQGISTLGLPAYTGGGTIARIYRLATPYAAVDLPYLKFTQSADVMTLCLVNQVTLTEYPTQELTRLAANSWTLTPPAIASSIGPPLSTSAVTSGGSYTATYSYVVTAIDAITNDESIASAIATAPTGHDISESFGVNTVYWAPPAGQVLGYNVYKCTPSFTATPISPIGQLFGFVGSTTGATTWQDTNIIPDFTTVPPQHSNPFANGQILGALMTNGGANYTGATIATMVSATGSGAVLTPIVQDASNSGTAHVVQEVLTETEGHGYQPTDTIVITDSNNTGSPSGATAVPIIQNGKVIGVTVTNNGTGTYHASTTSAAMVSSTGAGATFLVFIGSAGASTITGIAVNDPGQGYLPTDTISITDSGGGAGATAIPIVGPQSGNAPGLAGYFQQRRMYAASLNNPDTYEFSQPGSYTNFDASIPPIDSDAITGTPWALQVNGLQWAINMPGGLIVATGEDCWQLTGSGAANSPITPSQQNAAQQQSNGFSATVPPIKIDYQLLYVQALGSIVCSLNYNFYANIYTGEDVTVLSSHLMQNYSIVQWAWAREPYKVLWSVRSDGKMLALTWVKAQEVAGWTRHDTNGIAVSVASASEPPVNAVYWVIKRYIQGKGQWAYFMERMDNRLWLNIENVWAVDCGLSLPMPAPAATLTASAASPSYGCLAGPVVSGGANYTAPVGTITDLAGTGFGASVSSVTVVGGAITAFTISPEGQGYLNPIVTFTDSTGSGAAAEVILDTTLTFNASAAVFAAGNVASIIRMGGGKGTITSYVSPTQVKASMAIPITATVPDDPYLTPLPAAAGSWTMTAPVTVVTGLNDLNGMQVTGLADGNVIPLTTVQTGQITLANAASAITVGLPFLPQAQSMHADIPGQMIQGKRKRIQGITVRFSNTRGAQLGQDQPIAAVQPNQAELPWNVSPNLMTEQLPYLNDPTAGVAVPMFTGDYYFSIAGDYTTTDGQPSPGMVAVQQPYPLPLEILCLIPELDVGDLTGP
jgi:hypothetical protein